MTNERYNGWTNYETWAVKLWIDNDQGSQEYWLELARDICENEEDESDRITDLSERLQSEHEEAAAAKLGNECSLLSDLMGAALSSVNWREIAANLIEEYAEILS